MAILRAIALWVAAACVSFIYGVLAAEHRCRRRRPRRQSQQGLEIDAVGIRGGYAPLGYRSDCAIPGRRVIGALENYDWAYRLTKIVA
jgi:hypothetical protein